jgi:hypothetical protein
MSLKQPLAAPRYRTTPLRPQFVGADRGESPFHRQNCLEHWGDPARVSITYFTAEEQERHRIHFIDGRLHAWSEQANELCRLCVNEGGHAVIFVMDAAGEFYFQMDFSDRRPWLSHSSLLAGAPVAGAGIMEIRQGRVFEVIPRVDYDEYELTLELHEQVLAELALRGVRLDGVPVWRSLLAGQQG